MPDETRPPIVVICALADELVHLRDALPTGREEWRGGRCVWHTELDGVPILLALCGIGMMAAAAVTESVVGQYGLSAVLNFGCTGAHRPDLLPGDMVIGERVVAYQNVVERSDGTERYDKMKYLRRNVQEKVPHLEADPALLERAVRVAAMLEGLHEPWPTGAGWPTAVA